MEQSFPSKVDTWIVLAVAIPVVGAIVAIGIVAIGPSDESAGLIAALAPLVVLGVGLPLWIFRSTSYTVGADTLTVRGGPLRIVIPIREITRVKATRSLESSPALSLDRLAVEYGKGKRVLISPSDKAGFLKALARAGVDPNVLVG